MIAVILFLATFAFVTILLGVAVGVFTYLMHEIFAHVFLRPGERKHWRK